MNMRYWLERSSKRVQYRKLPSLLEIIRQRTSKFAFDLGMSIESAASQKSDTNLFRRDGITLSRQRLGVDAA